MAIKIEVKNEYLVAQGLDREEGQYLGQQGWWYYGDRSRAHGATLRALGVALHSRYLPANQCTVAAALLDAEHVVWTDSARAVVAASAKNLKASRDAGENNTLVIPAPEGITYRPYQIAGVQFALDAWESKRRGVLIGDEMGLGKTMQGIGAMRVLDAQHVLVLCLTSLKRNWLREVGKWWPEAPASIVDSAGTLLASHADRVTILSYSSLVGSSKRAKELREALSAQSFDLAVLDEAHVLKNEETQTSKFVLGTFKRGEKQAPGLIERAERVLVMTGTPIQNRVRESLPLIRAIDGIGESGIIEKDVSFLFRYCGPEKIYVPGRGEMRTFNGATHLDELQSRLRGGGFMVRRLKAQVATELPPKVRTLVRLDCAEFEGFDHAIKEVGFDDSHLHGVTSDFLAMAAYRARLAVRKAPQVIEHVQQLVDEGHKLLVFAHHETMIDALEQAFPACSLRIDGKTPEQDRQGLVDQFQIDASKRVGIISTRAGGTGLTLTAADMVVFAEGDWNPAACAQAEDRAHRIGQSADVVTVQYLVLDGTLDAHILSTMIRKLDGADRALDRTKEVADAPAPKPPKAVEPARKVEIKAKGKTVVYEITADRKAAIVEAFALLKGSCDGARSLDDVGFTGADAHSEFVQSLCATALTAQLSDKQAAWSLQVLTKYRNTQLAALATRLFSE